MRQAGTVTGMPAPIAACRAGFCPWPAVTACDKRSITSVPRQNLCWICAAYEIYNCALFCLCELQFYFIRIAWGSYNATLFPFYTVDRQVWVQELKSELD